MNEKVTLSRRHSKNQRRTTLAFVPAILIVAIVSGCSGSGVKRFEGVSPVFPAVEILPAQLDTLQPTMRWTPADEQDAQYDLIIYPFTKTNRAMPSRQNGFATANEAKWRFDRSMAKNASEPSPIYYREALLQAEHRVERQLESDTQYAWSIRIRRSDKPGSWATFDGYWTAIDQAYPGPLSTGVGVVFSPVIVMLAPITHTEPEAIAKPFEDAVTGGAVRHDAKEIPFRFVTPVSDGTPIE